MITVMRNVVVIAETTASELDVTGRQLANTLLGNGEHFSVTFDHEDVLPAWNRYVNALPWPAGAAFHESDLAKPGRFKPTHITWFGDDARFALANWRH
jgi:hypothetical protein